jgi:dienelactone hydrolase
VVLEERPEPGPRITPYLRYQLDRAWSQDEARSAAWAGVRTEADLLKLQGEIRSRLLDILGGLPETRTPLNPRVVGTIEREGYRIEKVIFESLPGYHVTALLYVPAGSGLPRPAVLVACGHSPLGKAFPNYQEICRRLARRGYVALCWDPVGQGERSQYWDVARGRSRYNLVCGEHAVLGNLALVAGVTLNRYMIWDGIRAVDYLLTRPAVDPRRISITGTSGGGHQSTYIGALDTRIGVMAPSCFVTALPMRMANRIFEDPDSDTEQDPFRLVSAGIDHPGLVLLAYPRPVIVSAAVKDFVPIEGARKTLREVAAFYRAFGKGDRIALSEGYHEHRFSRENQEAAFAFLDRFNGMPPRHGLDDGDEVLAPEALHCTPSGQVRVDLPGRSLPELIREEAREKKARIRLRLADLYLGEAYPAIRDWAVVEGKAAPGAIAWESAGRIGAPGAVVERYRLWHSERLVIPVLYVYGKAGPTRRVLLHTGLDGKARPEDWPEIEAHLRAGWDVLSFDARGLGETRMPYKAVSIDDPELAALDERAAYESPISGVLANYVYNSLLTGRPYFLQMMEDAEIVARFARMKLGAERVAITGPGEARLLAASVSRTLPGIELLPGEDGPVADWSRWVEELRETWPIHYLLPGGAQLGE